jgi:molybdopterin molybdotransferase
MHSVDDALKIIISNTSVKQESENTDLFNCHGRTLFKDLESEFDVPSKDNSAKDGYAVLYDDLKDLNNEHIVTLSIIDEIQAGHEYHGEKLQNGNAVRIMTGAHIPEGADCVVPFEDTEENGNQVKIFNKVQRFENIRFTGENIRKGGTVLKKGTRIDSAETGLLSLLNVKEIPVYKKPKVGIFSTGDELTEPGANNTDKIINSNAYVLYSEVKKYGGDPYYGGIVKDEYEDVKKMFLKSMDNDIIISSGGVSMGRYDFIPDVLKEIGIDIKIRKVLMKPGKPMVFGTSGEKLFFGLPGNPVSVMVSFIQFVRPAILKMSGNIRIAKPVVKAKADEDIIKNKGLKYFMRGIFNIDNDTIYVRSTGSQGSGVSTSISSANCLIVIPEEAELIKAGDYVDIQLIGHSEI